MTRFAADSRLAAKGQDAPNQNTASSKLRAVIPIMLTLQMFEKVLVSVSQPTNQETTMHGIDLDPQTTSDYWAHYLRLMKQAKT